MLSNEIIDGYAGLTMVPRESVLDTLSCVSAAPLHGSFVEMGCWKGGICFIVAASFDIQVEAFDSFEGLPKPTLIDGPAAHNFWDGQDRCVANYSECVKIADTFNGKVKLIPGWFKDTIQSVPDKISVLRLDCDWYKATKLCLEKLYSKVLMGGCIIIDDYSAYDGAAIAVHEFLGENGLSHRLHVVQGESGPQQARFWKR
jgi:O-methyltransferase